ncbi:MAG: hypothetical protein ACQEXG_17365 [Pseudomonadota bacterium]
MRNQSPLHICYHNRKDGQPPLGISAHSIFSFSGITTANSHMIRNLFKKTPIQVWAIKQIDDDTLHLIGKGVIDSEKNTHEMRVALLTGRYQGGVRIGDTGIVLHSSLLAAVVLLDELQLDESRNAARWQGRSWEVSWVPQRSWLYEGRLVAEQNVVGRTPALLSSEDVSTIRQHVTPGSVPPGRAVFRPGNERKVSDQDLRRAIMESQLERTTFTKGWRKDGSWGDLEDEEGS